MIFISLLKIPYQHCSLFYERRQLVLRGNRDHEIKFEAYDKDLDNDDFLGRWVSHFSCRS